MIANDRESLICALSAALDEELTCFTIISCTPEEIGDHMQTLPRIIHTVPNPHAATICLLRTLKIPPHTDGYKQLAVAIPLFAADPDQCFSKELYPAVAAALGCSNGIAVEHSIRNAIRCAWKRKTPAVWDQYFPSGKKPPSNKRFIATLAELLK